MKRKLLIFLTVLLIVPALTACDFIDYYKEQIYYGIISVRERAEEENEKIVPILIDAINSNNKDVIKKLLCEKSKEIEGIDNQIDVFLNSLDNEIISYKVQDSYEGYGADYGVVNHYANMIEMYNVITEDGQEYNISYVRCYINNNDPTYEGILAIYLENAESEDIATIGKWWQL